MRIYVTGNKGNLGRLLMSRFPGHEVQGGDLPEWDIADLTVVRETLHAFQPDFVIHAAALTAVDYCAEHPAEAVRVNGIGTYNIALASYELDATLIAISTNEVFDGAANVPYQEYDRRNPINPYGYSKYVAEQAVERYAGRYMIVRTAWLYAPGSRNFIRAILDRAQAGDSLRVVTDEIGSPTSTADLADGLARLIEANLPGVYHLVNEGVCSRYEFAQAILELAGLDVPVEPITLADFKRSSTPPPYAPLANVFAAAAGITLRPWRVALAAYIAESGFSAG